MKSARTPQAMKRARQADKRRIRNAALRSVYRTAIKKVLVAVEAADLDRARATYRAAVRTLDESVSKGILHGNKAARHKANLNKHVKTLAAS